MRTFFLFMVIGAAVSNAESVSPLLIGNAVPLVNIK